MTKSSAETGRASSLPPPLLQEIADLIKFFLTDLLVLGQVQQQRVCRTIENAFYKIVNHVSNHLAPWLGGAIDISSIPCSFRQPALLLENPHHGHDSRVSDLAALQELLINLAHGRRAELPDDLHDLELLIGKYGFPAFQFQLLI